MNSTFVFKAILGFFLVLFLPVLLFSQGAIIGYADGNTHVDADNLSSFPSNAQLDKLNHVIAVGLGVNLSGTLKTSDLPNYWNGNTNTWITSLVNRAHQRGVKVSISITGKSEFNAATETQQRRNAFVTEIVNFISDNGLDGVEINWEHPRNTLEWNNCIALLDSIKSELPNKKLSISLTPTHPSQYPNPNTGAPHFPEQIWEITDAIYLMTYDEGGDWVTHSDTTKSNNTIRNWGDWGATDGRNLCKGELFVASAFYGWCTDEDNCTTIGDSIRVPYSEYIGGTSWSNRGDLPADARSKAIYTRDNGFGGVFIWELGFDMPANHSQSLLKAIDDVMPYISGTSIVCNSNSTFALHNPPAGSTINWSHSSNLQYISGQGTAAYEVRASNTTANGAGWVRVILSGACQPDTLPQFGFWVGTPPAMITGPYAGHQEVACLNAGQQATMRVQPNPQAEEYFWVLHGESDYPMILGDQPESMPFSISGSHPPRSMEFRYRIQGCSWYTSSERIHLCNAGKILRISPNPASHQINITEIEAANDKIPWVLRLMSQQGSVMVSVSTTLPKTINVSGFQPGTYILHARRGQYLEQQVVIVE